MALINGFGHFNGILFANKCLFNVHVVMIIVRALEILRKGRYLRLHIDNNRNLACLTFLYIEYIKALRIYILKPISNRSLFKLIISDQTLIKLK